MKKITRCDVSFELLKNQIRLNGEMINIPREVSSILSHTQYKSSLTCFLAKVIYEQLHTRVTFKNEASKAKTTTYNIADKTLISLLEISNQGIGWQDNNWKIISHQKDDTILALSLQNGIKVKVPVSRVLNSFNSNITIKRAKSMIYASPGYYVGVSDFGMPDAENGQMARVYTNITMEGSCRFVERISLFAKVNQIKLYFKISNNQEGYARADASVIYLSIADFTQFKKELIECISKLNKYINDKISIFCKPLCFGSSYAFETLNDNQTVRSFGEKKANELAKFLLSKGETE